MQDGGNTTLGVEEVVAIDYQAFLAEQENKKKLEKEKKRQQCILHIQDTIRSGNPGRSFDCKRFCRCLHMATVFGSPITADEMIPPEMRKFAQMRSFCEALLDKVAEKKINPAKLA